MPALLAGAVPLVPAADWPRFRGVDGSGVAPEGSPPVTWDESTHVAWKAELPGPGASSPIVWRDRVYLTCHTGYGLGGGDRGQMEELVRHLLCFRLADGELLWSREVPAAQPESPWAKRMEWHGYASQTPVADDDGVIAFLGKSGVRAWNHDGEPRWQASVGDGTHEWGSAASPVLVGDLVVVNAYIECGALVALDRKTGEERWRYGGLNEAWDTPVVVRPENGKPELAIGIMGKVVGIDPATGDELWTCAAADWYIVGSPVARDGVVYSLSGKGFEAATAVRAGGRGDVTGTRRLWQTRKGSNVSSPVLHDGRLYFAHDQGSFFYCLDATNGETIFQERLPDRFGIVYSSPVIADGRIYLFSREGGSVVLEAGGEYRELARNPPLDRSAVNGSPAIAGDRLLVRSDRFLHCLADDQ